MRQLIAESIASFALDDYRPIVPRELDLGNPLAPRIGNLVKVVTGMRRSGKSYRLLQEIDRLMSTGVPANRICYFNFEDDRLAPVTPATGDEVIDAFFTLNPHAMTDGCYLFFDELQEMSSWGAWLRRVVDTTKATIYVSGSSSKMLSREISTEFRGRALDFELLPYSFSEYVSVTLAGCDAKRVYPTRQERIVVASALRDYLERGGFPASIGLPRPHATMLLQSYVERVVSRDVVERHAIARPRVATALARRALGTNAKPLSLRRVEADLRSLGLSTSRQTLADIMEYLEEAYLVFRVGGFSYALAEGTTSMPKVYAVDPGIALASAKANSNELGQRLENAVYLELRRRHQGMRRDAICSYVTKGHGWEVDFVVGDALEQQPYEFVQVSVDVSDERTRSRELRALWEAMGEAGLKESTLVVLEGPEEEHECNGMLVRQAPAWRWLLGVSR